MSASATIGAAHAQTPSTWAFAGGNIENTRSVVSPPGPQHISVYTAPTLTVAWTFNTKGAVGGTPTVEPGGLYVTDWANMLYKINPSTGKQIWSYPFSHYTGLGYPAGGTGSRSSPAIGSQGEIVVGDTNSGTVFAVNRTTGALIWKTLVETDPAAFFNNSAVIYNGVVYIGVTSSDEHKASSSPTYVPTFRGSVVALSETTGNTLWQVYMEPVGYTGAAIWNAQPVVFSQTNSLIVATGNNFSIPAAASTCLQNAAGNLSSQNACLDPTDHVDSVVALDLTTGHLNWSRRFQTFDTYTTACGVGFASCPNPEGGDVDFASAPNLIAVPNFVGVPDDRGGLSESYMLGVGQKNGVYWAINPYNGGLFWSHLVGNGEIKWGSAVNTNNAEAVVALDNGQHFTNTLAGSPTIPSYKWKYSSWGGINLKTGSMVWQLPSFGNDLTNPAYGSRAYGAISVSNQVAFAASSSGYMVAFDPATGNTLWSFNTGVLVESAPAIFNDTLYWGSGYRTDTGSTLYAFSIPTAAASASVSGANLH